MIKFLFDPKTPVKVTALVLLAAMTAVWFSPSEIPIHFMNGHADRFVSKWLGLFSSPGIMLLLLGIFFFARRILVILMQGGWKGITPDIRNE